MIVNIYIKEVFIIETQFLYFESKYNLLNAEINGFKYWQYIRFEMFREIQIAKGMINENSKNNYRSYKNMLKSIIFQNPFLYKKNIDLLVMGHYRYIKNKNNKYESIYTTPLLKDISYKYLLVEPYYEYNMNKDLELETTYYTSLQLKLNLFFRLKLYKFLPLDEFKREISPLVEKINEYFNVSLNEIKIHNIFIKTYVRWFLGKKYFTKLLSKYQPKLILEVVSYSPYNLILNEVAKSKSIPTIELQHGLIGGKHIAYNFFEKRNYEVFPDIILTYSDYWKKNTFFPLKKENIISCGFPYLENIVNEFTFNKNENINEYNILFISQWSIGKQLSEFAIELYDYLETNDLNHYKIYYQLHPEEKIEENPQYEKLVQYKNKINIIDSKQQSLYKSFSISSIQIGAYSTGLYEGLAFGLKTFIINVEGSERVSDLINEGYAIYVDSAEQVYQSLLNENAFYRKIDDFWKKDSLNNILSIINRIIEK